jgi:hypothetical protein
MKIPDQIVRQINWSAAAEDLGISANALRLRYSRLNVKLEKYTASQAAKSDKNIGKGTEANLEMDTNESE